MAKRSKNGGARPPRGAGRSVKEGAGSGWRPRLEDAQLGRSVKGTRILKGLKLRDLSVRVGCSESLISKIENGRTRPSLTMLHKIALGLDVTIPQLFSERGPGQGIVARHGERPSVRIDKAGSQFERLVPVGAGHLLEGSLHVLAPGGGSEGTLAHEGEEMGFIIAGELELIVDGEIHRLKAGDSFVFRSELAHSYRNPGKAETRVVWVSTPPTF